MLRDTNCCMQFWCWRVSVFPYLISHPLYIYICVCLTHKKKKKKKDGCLSINSTRFVTDWKTETQPTNRQTKSHFLLLKKFPYLFLEKPKKRKLESQKVKFVPPVHSSLSLFKFRRRRRGSKREKKKKKKRKREISAKRPMCFYAQKAK